MRWIRISPTILSARALLRDVHGGIGRTDVGVALQLSTGSTTDWVSILDGLRLPNCDATRSVIGPGHKSFVRGFEYRELYCGIPLGPTTVGTRIVGWILRAQDLCNGATSSRSLRRSTLPHRDYENPHGGEDGEGDLKTARRRQRRPKAQRIPRLLCGDPRLRICRAEDLRSSVRHKGRTDQLTYFRQ